MCCQFWANQIQDPLGHSTRSLPWLERKLSSASSTSVESEITRFQDTKETLSLKHRSLSDGVMHPCHIWQNLDRLSFCENAILLDLKSHSQGKPIKMRASQICCDIAPDSNLPRQMICDFLDDFALVVSGNGGKDNVSAACMEIDDQGGTIVLRVARNEGLDEQMMGELRRILQAMTQNIPAGLFNSSSD